MDSLKKQIKEETYHDLKRMITFLASKIKTAYGGELDDLISEGNLLLMSAIDTYEESKSKFSTYAYNQINHGLIDYLRKLTTHNAFNFTVEDDNIFEVACFDKNYHNVDAIDGLKADGVFILQLIQSDKISDILKNHRKGHGTPLSLEPHIRKYLMKELNWSKDRTAMAFFNLRQSLTVRN